MHVAWITVHTERLPRVCPKVNPVEEADKDVKISLWPLRLSRRNEATVGIEVRCQVLYRQVNYLHDILS